MKTLKKLDRFKSKRTEDDRRRAARRSKRLYRKKMQKVTRQGRQDGSGARIPKMCCGKFHGNCNCFQEGIGEKIATSFKRSVGKKIARSLTTADIVTENDIEDVPDIVKRLGFDSVKDSDWWLWGASMSFRLYNTSPTLILIEPCFLGKNKNCLPAFKKLELALTKAYKRGDKAKHDERKAHGGLDRTTTLLKYSFDHGVSWHDAPDDRIQRDILGLKLIWQALPSEVLALYRRSPSRDFWEAALAQLKKNLETSTRGLANDYMVKCMLDVVVLSKAVVPGTLSAWPINCPAYLKAIPKLYPNIPPKNWFLVFCHWHRWLSAQHMTSMTFPNAMAQL